MIKFLLLFFSTAFAQEATLTVNGQLIEVNSVLQVESNITAAVLQNTSSIKVGRNHIQSVPAGTRLSFFKNSGSEDNLKIRGLIITKKIPDQVYRFKDDTQAMINCGRLFSSVAFVSFSPSGELLTGCRSAVEQFLQTPSDHQKVMVHKGSKISFLESGLLQLSSETSGKLLIEENSISLKPRTSIGFHENGNLYFLHPNEGSDFSFATEIAEHTSFHQPTSETTYPVVFHSNQKISTAFLNLKQDHKITFEAFGILHTTSLKTGPVGFDEFGRVNRTVMRESAVFKVSRPTYVRRTEQNTGAVIGGVYELGSAARIAKNTQIFLDTKGDSPILESYPEFGQQGLAFLYELSYEPF